MKTIVEIKKFGFYYPKANKPSIKNINIDVHENKILSIIGPSGCGKSTLLRSINRIHCLYEGHKYEGQIIYRGQNILTKKTDLINLRSKIGMIFQKPTPFPMSIFENVAYGLRLRGKVNKITLLMKVEKALKSVGLLGEVKDRLDDDARELSGGQQQRLCIARASILEPDILLFDEPTSALDPMSTNAIEDLLKELRKKITIIIVTHNLKQAERISDYCAFMHAGNLIELDKTNKLFDSPKEKLTKQYISGNI